MDLPSLNLTDVIHSSPIDQDALVAAIANLHNAKIELSDNHPGLRCLISFDYPSGSA